MSVSDKAYDNLETRYLDLYSDYHNGQIEIERLRRKVAKLERKINGEEEDTD